MVAQVFNLCPGGVLLSPGGTGFQPVNPLRIIGVAGLNERVRDGSGCGPLELFSGEFKGAGLHFRLGLLFSINNHVFYKDFQLSLLSS